MAARRGSAAYAQGYTARPMTFPRRERSSSIRAPLAILVLALVMLGAGLNLWKLRQREGRRPPRPSIRARPLHPRRLRRRIRRHPDRLLAAKPTISGLTRQRAGTRWHGTSSARTHSCASAWSGSETSAPHRLIPIAPSQSGQWRGHSRAKPHVFRPGVAEAGTGRTWR